MEDDNKKKSLRIFFLPFFASGHMIPIADLAILFSHHSNVEPTLCLTPANADFLRPSLPSSITILTYPFPSEAAGLPPGIENLSSVSREDEWKIYKAVDLSQPAHHDLLHHHYPDAIIADVPFWWTTNIANELSIPRITWHAVGVFPQLIMNSLYNHRNDTIGKDHTNIITVKDLPGPETKIPVSELPEFARTINFMTEVWPTLKKAQLEGFGVVVNTFYEFEPVYCDYYRKTDCKRGWFVGPVALARNNNKMKNEQGNSNPKSECLDWLDGKEQGSVVFVCFGSWCYFKDEQLKEIALGLENSGRCFLWAVRVSDGDWLPDSGWEKRMEGKGKVVRGWISQVSILGHNAIGAFLTHCGWNSVMESFTSGVPILTWPLVFEQFINERLVVEVLEVGERVSNEKRSTKEEEKVVVPREVIAKVVARFMEEEEGGRGKRRVLARKYAEMARTAVDKGGSSFKDLECLIQELRVVGDDKLKGKC